MNVQETLKSPEIFTPSLQERQDADSAMTKEEITALYTERKNRLEAIRSMVCLKFYNDIGEKLKHEKQQFERLLNFQDAKEEALSHYSFVLNPYYFEQKFFHSEI